LARTGISGARRSVCAGGRLAGRPLHFELDQPVQFHAIEPDSGSPHRLAGPTTGLLCHCYRCGVFLTAANRGPSGFSVRKPGWNGVLPFVLQAVYQAGWIAAGKGFHPLGRILPIWSRCRRV